MKFSRKNKKAFLIIALGLFIGWFFTREIQSDLPYKASATEIVDLKNECKKIAEEKISIWDTVSSVDLISSGYSEKGGFCYMEYLSYFENETFKKLYNTTDEKNILTKEWPSREHDYQKAFDWFINGKRRFYQKTF